MHTRLGVTNTRNSLIFGTFDPTFPSDKIESSILPDFVLLYDTKIQIGPLISVPKHIPPATYPSVSKFK